MNSKEDEQRCLEERRIKAIISNNKDFYCAGKELGCSRSELVQFYYRLPKDSYKRIKNGLTRLRRRQTKEGESNDFCALGCICSSLHRGPVSSRHCGNVSCMFGCTCGFSPEPSKRDNRPISAEDIPSSNRISRVLLRYIPKEGKLSLTRHVYLPPVNASQFWIFVSLDQEETYTSLHWKSFYIKTKSVIALVNECLKHNSGKRMFYHVPGFTKNFSIIAVPGLKNFVFAGPIKSSSPTITESGPKDIMIID
ncbi:MGA [Lepeophtheirus salmonis]|uniref:MGA n=1 Tax=Lepeophtheirus salmonis TaxID=72036 RepID=A0A7R8HEN9_LEPSM|nr:MGA [Lepeophtheirus salmonis]CAF3046006.1 MGA [Lepeophtheirus salmonis]